MPNAEWDVFISHAWEDKEFAGQLANELKRRGLRVWYDQFTLRVGDSLRESIDRGLTHSRFGVVVLSRDFFAKKKKWTRAELNGLFALERPDKKVILPVWHNITAEELGKYSPILADRLAASSDRGLEQVVTELLQAIDEVSSSSSTTPPTTPGIKGTSILDSVIQVANPYLVQISIVLFAILIVVVLIFGIIINNIQTSVKPTEPVFKGYAISIDSGHRIA